MAEKVEFSEQVCAVQAEVYITPGKPLTKKCYMHQFRPLPGTLKGKMLVCDKTAELLKYWSSVTKLPNEGAAAKKEATRFCGDMNSRFQGAKGWVINHDHVTGLMETMFCGPAEEVQELGKAYNVPMAVVQRPRGSQPPWALWVCPPSKNYAWQCLIGQACLRQQTRLHCPHEAGARATAASEL